MGTHNALLRLGDSVYVEVIAPNPAAEPPARPRWFELDRLDQHARPRLAAWVARTDNIRSAVEECGYRFGPIEAMNRGRFSWLITIPPDGSLPGRGAIPMLMEWTVDEHPAGGLEDHGLRLSQLEIFHSRPRSISELLACLDLGEEVVVRHSGAGAPRNLVAQIETPAGTRTLSG